jgi:urease beta subunit
MVFGFFNAKMKNIKHISIAHKSNRPIHKGVHFDIHEDDNKY